MHIRFADPGDAAACLAVYAQYIDTSITFETVLPSEAEFSGRIRSYGAVYPWLIAEEDGRVLAYAYAHRAQERAAYGWNAELSIYIAKAYVGHGLGRLLYEALMELLRRQGVKTVYGVVTSPNPPSEALHQAMGFHVAARFRDAGWKNGEWHDVTWFEREIAPHDGAPQPLRPIGEVVADEVLHVCGQAINERFAK